MKNIIDYVQEEKASFSSKLFGGVDSLVLSQLAYLYFDGFVSGITKHSDSVTIEALASRENRELLFKNTKDSFFNQRLFLALKDSPRICIMIGVTV